MSDVWRVTLRHTTYKGEMKTVHVFATNAARAEERALRVARRDQEKRGFANRGKYYVVSAEFLCSVDGARP